MFTRWGAFVYRRRRWIAVLAIVVAGAFGSLGRRVSSHLTSGGWLDPSSESAQVSDRLEKDFGAGRTSFIALFESDRPERRRRVGGVPGRNRDCARARLEKVDRRDRRHRLRRRRRTSASSAPTATRPTC